MKRRITLAETRDYLQNRFPRIAGWAQRASAWVVRFIRTNAPGPRAWNGAATGLILATVVFTADTIIHRALLPAPTMARVVYAGRSLGLAVLAGIGVVLAAALVSKLSWRNRFAFVICGVILSELFPFEEDGRGLLWGIAAFAAVGASVATITRDDLLAVTTRVQRFVAIGGVLAGLTSILGLIYWLRSDGYDPLEYRNAAVETDTAVATLDLPDPSIPGEHGVLELTYGGGTDVRRHEFGRSADLITETIDGTRFLEPWDDRWGLARKAFWGFDRDELPLQGRVWYPDGPGPFPLVLIVHGNHSMEEFSDPGYEYLGELLASRGFILVSVDQNFINGSIRQENDARGWLLLEHLRVWEQWNEDPENPFYGLVDTGRIGLIGHSRGGEAVAVAAAFNDLPYYPDDATVEFDYHFDIGAVIAIAPIMGQYRPGGRFTTPRNINYFVIHGANDMDVSSFSSGSGQFEKVTFSGDEYRFKSALYVMNANHGQFNTVWGRYDGGRPRARGMNVHPLMPGEEQRQIAVVYISAFLEVTLRDEVGYLPLFADARTGADWLPDTAYLLEFDDSRSLKIATFDEDVDVTTTTAGGGLTRGENLSVWREQVVEMKWGTKETAAVYLGWHGEEEEAGEETEEGAKKEAHEEAEGGGGAQAESEGPAESRMAADAAGAEEEVQPEEHREADGEVVARYIFELPPDLSVDPAGSLIFSMADANESPERDDGEDEEEDEDQDYEPEEEGEEQEEDEGEEGGEREKEGEEAEEEQEGEEEEEEEEDAPREPIDLTIRIIDAMGEDAEVPLGRFSLLQPQLEVQLWKSLFTEAEKESEPVFQSFIFPLAWFVDANPALDTTQLRRLEFVFDKTESGVIILDSVGFRRPPASSGGPSPVVSRR